MNREGAEGSGSVSLVGAGPGDPGLITVAGRERLRRADVVVYDRLAHPALVAEAPADAERIYVGKASADHAVPQDEIGRLLVDRARAGKRVVRLKGGDPFVFGRGGEEADDLVAAGVEFDVVPGITSAIAVPAYAGIPITHRDAASSFAVVTGHEAPGKPASRIDWAALATGVDTLVFLMGRRALAEIAAQLIAEGRDPATPAAAIEWGTTPRQRTVAAPLSELADAAEAAALSPPTVIVVGDVVALRERLRWYDDRPLFGKRVLVTRTRAQAGKLSSALWDAGAEPIEFPAIEIVPRDPAPAVAAATRLAAGDYDWAVFTSANGVDAFWRAVEAAGLDARAFGGVRLAAIGPATVDALAAHGLRTDVVPGSLRRRGAGRGAGAGGRGGRPRLAASGRRARATCCRRVCATPAPASTTCPCTRAAAPPGRTRPSSPGSRPARSTSPASRPPRPCAAAWICSTVARSCCATLPSPASGRSPPRPPPTPACASMSWRGSTRSRGWWPR